ncbi:hypothetical protein, partial [Streptosporangium roseum]|uniref:hypothetical protein n=1 Tax=Streptosporangium roseum TaxID=2001 RepID=UPI000560D5E1
DTSGPASSHTTPTTLPATGSNPARDRAACSMIALVGSPATSTRRTHSAARTAPRADTSNPDNPGPAALNRS